VTSDEILIGVGLTLVLAVGSQILATRLRLPAIVVLLPVGFVAGALTEDLDPERLLGAAFEPLVGLAVAVILYDAALALDVRRLAGHHRRVVRRLLGYGTVLTCLSVMLAAVPLLGMSQRAALMLGAILIVSGPTVVGPLLEAIRPNERLRRIFAWEGSLIDPIGGVLGALVFHGVVSSTKAQAGYRVVEFLVSVTIGLVGGMVGAGLLWLVLRGLQLGEVLGTAAQLALVIGIAAGCDVIGDDTGLVAAIVMGLAAANLRGIDIPARRPFFETLVQLIIGLLFISISATVTPDSLSGLVLPSLGLVAVLVLVVRPAIAWLSTVRTTLTTRERAFIGWLAPRGIVAAATASTFSTGLVSAGIAGGEKVLPATFLVIVATVTVYGLSAATVARWLGVTRPTGTRVLLVGGDPWVLDLAGTLRAAGSDVLVWASPAAQRRAVREAGLALAPGELMADTGGGNAEMDGISAVLLLTADDNFNALAATTLADLTEGQVYRLAAPPDSAVVVGAEPREMLFDNGLTRAEVVRRWYEGHRVVLGDAAGVPDGGSENLLFVVRPGGYLDPVTHSARPQPQAGDAVVLLERRAMVGCDGR
jgi:NhaP-type Na+/H+ or K+/H+ antiporter